MCHFSCHQEASFDPSNWMANFSSPKVFPRRQFFIGKSADSCLHDLGTSPDVLPNRFGEGRGPLFLVFPTRMPCAPAAADLFGVPTWREKNAISFVHDFTTQGSTKLYSFSTGNADLSCAAYKNSRVKYQNCRIIRTIKGIF